jgi:hypothetical protein
LRSLPALVLAAAVIYGMVAAVQLLWVCDDAFISFRYAENLVHGHGLVFNVGERVEGYTNFLWTLGIAAGMRLGVDPVTFTGWAGLACFAATIALLALAGARIAAPGAAFVPIAAVCFAAHEHAQVFASGGLETSLFTLLVTAIVLATAAARGGWGLFAAGTLGVLATMTRPDGILWYGVAGARALWLARERRSAIPLIAVALPGLLFYAPYFAWKWSYYGYPVPNTFYAKSAHSPYPDQGLYYIGLYFGCYFVLVAGALAALVSCLRRAPAGGPPLRGRALPAVILGGVAVYLAFVAWVGGDFMFARFLVPLTPALYLGFDALRARWPGARFGIALLAVALAATLLRRYPAEEITTRPGGRRGVVEERLNYPPATTAAMREAGLLLRDVMAGQDSRVVITGAQAVWAYYGRFTLVIEGCTGLTDEHLAHLPLDARGPVGHEKSITRDPGYLLRRRVQFSLHLDPVPPAPDSYRHIAIGPVRGVIITYQNPIMRHLSGRPGVEFVDFEDYLDRYIAGIDARSDAEVASMYAEAKLYYFDYNDDPAREARFRARLAK